MLMGFYELLTKWPPIMLSKIMDKNNKASFCYHEEKEKLGQDLINGSPHPCWLCDHDPLCSQTLPLSPKWNQFSQSRGGHCDQISKDCFSR